MTDQKKTNLFMIVLGIITITFSIYFNKENSAYLYIITYMGIVFIIITLPDNKYFNWFKAIVLIPAGIIGVIGPLLKILFEFIFAYFLPLGFIAMFFKYVPEQLLNINIAFAAKVYLTLTTTSIFITLCSEKLMIWCRKTMNSDNPRELLHLYNDLGNLLINKQRTRYTIFFSFFCYLLLYSIASLNNIELFTVKNTNVAIMQTFATYVAFDRLLSNKNLFEFNPKLFLSKISLIWGFDFSQNKNQNSKKEKYNLPKDENAY